jgi:outer membrane protein assembly factor BamB
VVAVDRSNGSISTPVSAGGRLFAAGGHTPQGEAGSVIAFDPATGQTLWKHVTPGYVIAPAAAIGEVLIVESSAPDGTAGTVEVLEQSSGKMLKSFSGSVAIFGAPSVGHGFVVFGDALGHVTPLVAPKYR